LTVRRAVELLHTARQAGRRAAVAVAVAVAAVLRRRYWALGTEGSTGGAGQELDWIFLVEHCDTGMEAQSQDHRRNFHH
jgi:hypothetical protein